MLEFLRARRAGVACDLSAVETMRWTPVLVETRYVSVGEVPAGEWRRRVRLFVKGAAGVDLAVHGDAGTGVGSTLVAKAPRTRLTRARSTFAVDLSGRARKGARYPGAHVRVEPAGNAPVWVTGSRVAVEVGGDYAQATVEAEEVAYGRVDRGTSAVREVRFVPNARARNRGARVALEVLDVPTDVDVTVEPRAIVLGEAASVTVRVAPRGVAAPGTYESRIVLKPQEGLALDRRELRVRYEVGHGGVRLQEKELAFGDVVRGTDAVQRLTLVPDQGAIETGAEIEATVEGFGEGVEVEVQPRFTLFGKTALEVRVRVSSMHEHGPVEGVLRFAASGNVRVLPDEVPVTIEVVPPPDVALTRHVDIGTVRQSQLQGHPFSFAVDIDPAHHGTVIEFVPADPGTQVLPTQVRLREGRQQMHLKLRTDKASEGKQTARFTVFSLRDGSRRAEGEVQFAWTVEESFVRVLEWKQPEPLDPKETVVEGTLVVDASPDLRGRTIRIGARFEEAGRRTRIAPVQDSFDLIGGIQTVPVEIDVVAADAGEHGGFLDLEIDDAEGVQNGLKPVAVRIRVAEAPPLFSLLSPDKRDKLYLAGGAVLVLLVSLVWLLRRNRRVVHRMVRFTPPPHPNDAKSIKEVAESFAFEEELR